MGDSTAGIADSTRFVDKSFSADVHRLVIQVRSGKMPAGDMARRLAIAQDTKAAGGLDKISSRAVEQLQIAIFERLRDKPEILSVLTPKELEGANDVYALEELPLALGGLAKAARKAREPIKAELARVRAKEREAQLQVEKEKLLKIGGMLEGDPAVTSAPSVVTPEGRMDFHDLVDKMTYSVRSGYMPVDKMIQLIDTAKSVEEKSRDANEKVALQALRVALFERFGSRELLKSATGVAYTNDVLSLALAKIPYYVGYAGGETKQVRAAAEKANRTLYWELERRKRSAAVEALIEGVVREDRSVAGTEAV
jgi:hypothetical protein